MSNVPHAKFVEVDGAEAQVIYELPFDSVAYFGAFFTILEGDLYKYHVSNFGVTITSLEDVFLKVGEDHSVKPKAETGAGIGNLQQFESSLVRQTLGMMKRKLDYARKDFVTIPLLALPSIVGIIAAVLYKGKYISGANSTNDLVVAGIYIGGYLGAPGLIAEFIVRERTEKLRNLLTVMGCDFRAYWIGTFLADFILMCIPLVVIFIAWGPGHMYDFASGSNGVSFFLMILFTVHFISFAYLCSFMFTNPKYCIAIMPLFVIFLIIAPVLAILLFTLIFDIGLHLTSIPTDVEAGINLWGIMMLSPHGALFSSLLDATFNFSQYISSFPPLSACIVFMVFESVLFLYLTYYYDSLSIAKLEPVTSDPTFNEACLANLDDDVQAERNAVLATVPPPSNYRNGAADVVALPLNAPKQALRIERLRKVFPPKRKNGPAVVAAEDVCFGVNSGEIFGLLGANGAGKTTTLSMLTRHLVPTSGNATIADISILSNFPLAANHLGVVTQNNSLWDLLTVEDHLYLFARLRGVPTRLVAGVVDATIDQLELTPHRYKQAMRLSGGMKRKLCVAIALIGDPEVVLLDEPSAGLDPVSRRNLWSVILRTMSHRAVVLTTHSMEEAEALCHRIGIMVKGQLRALGTKQHLKNKFGSGYELTVKLKSSSESLQVDAARLSKFVVDMFSEAKLIGLSLLFMCFLARKLT
jgi:ABC-type multidrug transport system ATPase subunit